MDLSSVRGLSPGTLIVLQRELETNPGFKDYLNEMLRDPDPAKRIFIEMQKSKMNVLNPKAFDKDVNTKKWQWSRRRIKPIVMYKSGMQGMGDLGIFSMIASALVTQGAKELQKESTQKSVANYTQNKTSNKGELRKRREDVMNEARKIGLKNTPENYKKAETVAAGNATFEEAFGLTPKLTPGTIKKISEEEIAYQNAQAAKLSEEGADALGAGKERKAGKSANTTTLLIGGGIAAAVLAILAKRKK